MKTAVVETSKPKAPPAPRAVSTHRQTQDNLIAAVEASGDTAAAAKLRAFYARHPLRGLRKGEKDVVEVLHAGREARSQQLSGKR